MAKTRMFGGGGPLKGKGKVVPVLFFFTMP
jgi:hypothetical protein